GSGSQAPLGNLWRRSSASRLVTCRTLPHEAELPCRRLKWSGAWERRESISYRCSTLDIPTTADNSSRCCLGGAFIKAQVDASSTGSPWTCRKPVKHSLRECLRQGSADTGRIPYFVTLSGAKGLRQHAEEILRFAQNDRRPVSGFLTAKDRLTLTGIRGPCTTALPSKILSPPPILPVIALSLRLRRHRSALRPACPPGRSDSQKSN